MATGLEMYRALREKTKSLPPGSVVKINAHDNRDVCKLTAAELVEVGFDETVAKRVRSDLLAGSVTELGKALALDLVIDKVLNLIPGEGIRRARELLKDDPQTLEEMLQEIYEFRHRVESFKVSFLLDADTCSAALKNSPRVFSRFVQYGGRLHTSRIVIAELYDWAFGGRKPHDRLNAIDRLVFEVTVLEFDDDCAKAFGRLRRIMRGQGTLVPDMDLLIASTAWVHGFTVVTHNTQDFSRIPGLSIVDWL